MDLKRNEQRNYLEICPHCKGEGSIKAGLFGTLICYLCIGFRKVDWITYMKYKGANNGN